MINHDHIVKFPVPPGWIDRTHTYPEPKWRELTTNEHHEIHQLIIDGSDDIWEIAKAYDCSTSQVAGIKAAITRRGARGGTT